MFQSLPLYHPMACQNAIRDEFRKRIRPDMTEEEKNSLQQEFLKVCKQVCKQTEQDNNQKRKVVALQNTAVFLSNPKACLDFIEENRGVFTMGEMLSIYGIGSTTIKRFGKGEFRYKGTLAARTISNFKVTANIGEHSLTMELSADNSKREKDGLCALVLFHLAKQIAST